MIRRAHKLMMLAAIATASWAGVAGSMAPVPAAGIDADTLARWLRTRTPTVVVIDVRTAEAFALGHVPSARLSESPGELPSDAVWIAYGDDEALDGATLDRLQARFGPRGWRALSGGWSAWEEAVLRPSIATDANAAERRNFAARASLSRYFGGQPRVLAPGESRPVSRRRGC